MPVVKDSLTYLIAEFVSKITPFLLTPYLTRRMGVDDYGIVSYYQTIIVLFLIFIGLSQESAIARYYYKYGKRSLKFIIQSCIFYNFAITFLLIILFSILGLWNYILLVFLASLQSLFSMQLAIRQCQKKAKEYLCLQIFNCLILFLFTLFLFEILVIQEIKAWIFSFILTYFVCVLLSIEWTYLFQGKKINIRTTKLMIIYFLSYGVPLILHQLSTFAKGHLDKIYIYNYFDAHELGYYSAALQIASIISIFFLALNKAILPYYFELLKKNKINKISILIFSILTLFLLPVVYEIFNLIPGEFYEFFLGHGFGVVQGYVKIFALAFTLMVPYLIIVNYFFYNGKVLLIGIVSFIAMLVYILSLYIISGYGILYMPYSVLISNVVQIIFLYIFLLLDDKKCK